MANKNSKYAQKRGFSSMDDMNRSGGNQIFKGSYCNTAWDNPNSNKNARKVYKRQNND